MMRKEINLASYIDSSLLLNIIYSENNSEKYISILNKSDEKFSSILLEIETRQSIYFIHSQHKNKLPENWLHDAEIFLKNLISQINLKNVDVDIINEINKNIQILDLKSLDAAHLATALHIRSLISENLIFCSLDDRLRNIAKKQGLNLYPKNLMK